ncbi:hypothetical protein [Fictibacillus sp. BK138]|uniref:hypothetical protein n=1 Tax=Fictibacillus sp. BK138 TaxID=2512121 RepID=UPI0010295F6F|nr:hypothetical protein [Fictibacillus sp. BK138]RZT15560.1 hypothetical protein EV282_3765 [Fictibacillus sp. BK138]
MLHGIDIEVFWGEFSEGLGIAKDPYKNREHKLLYFNEYMDRLIFKDEIVLTGIDDEFIYKGSSQV